MADKLTAETIKLYMYEDGYYTRIDKENVMKRMLANSVSLSNGSMTRLQMLNMFTEFMTFSELQQFAIIKCPSVQIKFKQLDQVIGGIIRYDKNNHEIFDTIFNTCGKKYDLLGERFALTFFTGTTNSLDLKYEYFTRAMTRMAKERGIEKRPAKKTRVEKQPAKKPHMESVKKQRVCEDVQSVVSEPKSIPFDDSEDYKIAFEWDNIDIMNTMFDFLDGVIVPVDDDCPIVPL